MSRFYLHPICGNMVATMAETTMADTHQHITIMDVMVIMETIMDILTILVIQIWTKKTFKGVSQQ
jgi:hypothetical protein